MSDGVIQDFLDEAKARMQKSVEATKTEFATVRTGRASPHLLDQKHVNEDKHESKTIGELRSELASNTSENVVIRRFARFQVGGE